MKGALGSSLLLYIVLFFVGVIIVFFCGIIAYSKAYKVKNRIVEIIENSDDIITDHGVIKDDIKDIIQTELGNNLQYMGYGNVCNSRSISKHLDDIGVSTSSLTDGSQGYCIFESTSKLDTDVWTEQKSYIVVTFVHFDIPVIGDVINIPVYGSTKAMGRTYDY